MWTFLDKVNYNLLYEYADVLAGAKTYINLHTADEEKRKMKAYYLIYFVYRYVLRFDRLEDALQHIDEDTLTKYHLKHFLDHHYLYVGIGENKRVFYKPSDMSIILEILYNRYDFWEQLECFCRHTQRQRKRQCLEAIESYRTMYRRISNDRQNDI